MDPELIPLVLIGSVVVYLFVGKAMVTHVFAVTEDDSPFAQAFYRSLIAAMFFGVGVIGDQGFALPAPALFSVWASMLLGAPSVDWALLGFAASWATLFVWFYFRDNIAHYGGTPPREGTPSGWSIFKGLFIAGWAVSVIGALLMRPDPPDEADVRRALQPYFEKGPAAIEAVLARENRLPCHGENLDAYLDTPDVSGFTVFSRIRNCGEYEVNVLSEHGSLAGMMIFATDPWLPETRTVPVWRCSQLITVRGRSGSIMECGPATATPRRSLPETSAVEALVSTEDFLPLVGDDWTGNYREFDRQNQEISRVSGSLSISITEANEIGLSYAFADGDSERVPRSISISKAGDALNGAAIEERSAKTDGLLRLVASDGTSENRVRSVYVLSNTTFVLRVVGDARDRGMLRREFVFARRE